MKHHHHALLRNVLPPRVARFLVAPLIVASIATSNVSAQTTSLSDTARQRPTFGATFGVTVPTGPSTASGMQAARHRGSNGNVCLRVSAVARPGAGTSRLFSHWVIVENTCSTTIRLQVCYYETRDCIDIAAAGDSRKEAILGMMPAIKDFRFEYRERF